MLVVLWLSCKWSSQSWGAHQEHLLMSEYKPSKLTSDSVAGDTTYSSVPQWSWRHSKIMIRPSHTYQRFSTDTVMCFFADASFQTLRQPVIFEFKFYTRFLVPKSDFWCLHQMTGAWHSRDGLINLWIQFEVNTADVTLLESHGSALIKDEILNISDHHIITQFCR